MLHAQTEFRQSDRYAVDLSADLQLPWGRVSRIRLTDLSSSGCRIWSKINQLAVGDKVLIRTPYLSGACGVVQWCKGGEAGIAFTEPLDNQLFAQLQASAFSRVKMIVMPRHSGAGSSNSFRKG